MASLFKDARTSVFVVEFNDRQRRPRTKRVSTSVRDARSAERLRRFWEAEYAEGRYDPWTVPPPVPGGPERPAVPATLGEARAVFLASRAHRAANTRANYERVTGWFVVHAGVTRPVSGVTAADVQAWIDSLSVKPITRANYVQHLRTFFRYCRAQKMTGIDASDGVMLERVPRQYPKALRPEQVEAVAVYAETHCRDGQVRSSAWAAPFVRLGAETALRRNELLNLMWDHVSIDAAHLTVACTDSFTSKSGAERRIPLSARALDVLAELRLRPNATGLVFEAAGRAVDPNTCSDTVGRFADRAGVPSLTPHVLRHSCITWLIERGVPVAIVQQFAGHADIATTMKYVSVAGDVYADKIRQALDC